MWFVVWVFKTVFHKTLVNCNKFRSAGFILLVDVSGAVSITIRRIDRSNISVIGLEYCMQTDKCVYFHITSIFKIYFFQLLISVHNYNIYYVFEKLEISNLCSTHFVSQIHVLHLLTMITSLLDCVFCSCKIQTQLI